MRFLISLVFTLFFTYCNAQIKLFKDDADRAAEAAAKDSIEVVDASDCKPYASSKDLLTEEDIEFYGGKLETNQAFLSRVRYKNKLYFYWDYKSKQPYVILQIGSTIDLNTAMLLRESYETGSEVGIRAGDEVFWLKVNKVQKGDYISSKYLYTNNYLFCPTDFDTLRVFQEKGILAYQYTNSNNEDVQGDILSGKTSKISSQLACFITKYHK